MIKNTETNRLIKTYKDKLIKEKETNEKVSTLLHMANTEGYIEGGQNTSRLWRRGLVFNTVLVYVIGLVVGRLLDSWAGIGLNAFFFTTVYLLLSFALDGGSE